MGIPNKNFAEALRLKFISLLESKRGIQAKLSESIGKSSSYFSEIKRGNPVNAMHLKAVAIVFGPEKAIELLDIDNKLETKTYSGNENLTAQFKNPKKIKRILEDLLILEKVDFDGFKEIHKIIEMKIEAKQPVFKKKDVKRKKIS